MKKIDNSRAKNHANDFANGHANGQPHNHARASFHDHAVTGVSNTNLEVSDLRADVKLLWGVEKIINFNAKWVTLGKNYFNTWVKSTAGIGMTVFGEFSCFVYLSKFYFVCFFV